MNPKSYSLHHFTREFQTLKLIMLPEGGFWPRYSMEDFSWVHHRPHYIGSPCVCFCDLPFEASAMHRADYGEYVISFDKSSDLAKKLTPLIYVNDEGPMAEIIRSKYGKALLRFGAAEKLPDGVARFTPAPLIADELKGLWDFLPYLKATLGHTLQRRPPPANGTEHEKMPGYDHGWATKFLEEEFEWRFVPPKYKDALYCLTDYSRWEMAKLDVLSKATMDSFLTFQKAEIEMIVVKTDMERDEIAGIYPELPGRIKTWSELPEQDEDKDA